MPPSQNNQAPKTEPNPYGFIFNGGQKPKRNFSLSGFGMSRPVAIGGTIVGGFLLIILILSLLGRGSSVSPLTDIAARQQEIIRVSNLTSGKTQDVQTQNLALSVSAVLTSHKVQLTKYLGIKINDGSLVGYLNKSTDSQLLAASQNNSFDSTYLDYLQKALNAYLQAIGTAKAPTDAKNILDSAASDAQTLLAAPQLKAL